MKKLQQLFTNKAILSKLYAKQIFGAVSVGAALMTFCQHADAQTVIVQDGFTGSGSAYGNPGMGYSTAYSFSGLYPDTANAGGTPWQFLGGGNYDTREFSGAKPAYQSDGAANYAYFHNGAAVGITTSGYTGILQTKATLLFNNGNTAVAPDAIAVAGFSSQVNTNSSYPSYFQHYTGLAVSPSGALQEVVNGIDVGSAEAYTGTFSAYTKNTLTYDLNTATGAITDVSFGGSTTAYSFLTPSSFSGVYTAFAEIGGNASGVDYDAGADSINFTSYELETAAAPEPSTYALLLAGGAALGAMHWRRRKNA